MIQNLMIAHYKILIYVYFIKLILISSFIIKVELKLSKNIIRKNLLDSYLIIIYQK
jgi:hypothetical protein